MLQFLSFFTMAKIQMEEKPHKSTYVYMVHNKPTVKPKVIILLEL